MHAESVVICCPNHHYHPFFDLIKRTLVTSISSASDASSTYSSRLSAMRAIFIALSITAAFTTAAPSRRDYNCWIGTLRRGEEGVNLAPDGAVCRHNLPDIHWDPEIDYTYQQGTLCCDACRESEIIVFAPQLIRAIVYYGCTTAWNNYADFGWNPADRPSSDHAGSTRL